LITAVHHAPSVESKRMALFDRVIGGVLGVSLPLLVASEATSGVVAGLGVALIMLAPGRAGLLAALAQCLKTPLAIAVLALLIAWIPSIAISIMPLRSLSAWGGLCGILLGAGIIGCAIARSPEVRALCLKALVIGSLACGALALIAVHGGSAFYAPFRGRAFEAFEAHAYIKYYASAVACLAPVTLFAGWRLGGAWRKAAFLYPAMALAIILSLDSGAGLLGLIAGAIVFVLIAATGVARLRSPAYGLLILVLAAGLAGIGWLFANAPPPPPPEALAGATYSGPIETPLPLVLVDAHRQQIWGFALNAVPDAPWFGHGLRTSNLLPGAHVKIVQFHQEFVPSHTHDWLIEVLVDTGFVGLAGLLLALGALVWRWLTVARVDRLRAAAGLGLMAAFLSSSLLNFSFWSAWWQTEFLVLSAILLALPPAGPRAAAANPTAPG